MRAKEIAQLLARNAKAVAAELLPNGKEQGGEWCAGSVDGEAGQSLRVTLNGERAGLWVDFANRDHRGDLLDLWRIARGCDVNTALREAADWLGVAQPLREPPQQRPSVARPKCVVPKSAVRSWLMDTRGLSAEAVTAYRIGERGDELVMPYLAPDGELWGVKCRNVHDKHKTRWEKGSVPRLFGWPAIPENDRHVVICEGEMDALAWFEYGFPALSVPAGASGHKWVEVEFDALERFDVIYLSFDMDAPGQQGARELAARLGIERCHLVKLPKKDANDCLKASVPDADMAAAIANAKTLDPDELRSPSDYTDAVVNEFWGSTEEVGIRTPWKKVEDKLVFRPGEVSILAGINGHGKSQMAGHLTADALRQGEKACVASMEFVPHKWLRRLVRQLSGMRQPSENYIRACMRYMEQRLWVFDVVGTAKVERLIEVFRYAARRYGVTFFVVDNLAKCGLGEDDYNGQKEFIDRMTDFAKSHDVHVMVVMHMRKQQDEMRQAGKMDVKGTGALTDMVDTVLNVWRNKAKEKERRDWNREQEALDPHARQPFDETESPDAVLRCDKQRNGEEEPSIALWFDPDSFQYMGGPGQKPFRYVQWSEAASVHEGVPV